MNKRGLLVILVIISVLFISSCQIKLPKISPPSTTCCEILNLDGTTESCIKNINEIDCSSTYIGKDGYNYYSQDCSEVPTCSNKIVCAYNGITYPDGLTACSENKLYQCDNGSIKQIENDYYTRGFVYTG